MESNFHTFAKALEALCSKHGVFLTGEEGRVVVWDREADRPAVLFNRTGRDEAPRTKPLPHHIETLIEARARAGFISHELSRRDAEQMSKQHPGSEVVPIVSYRPRGWVVVMPEKA